MSGAPGPPRSVSGTLPSGRLWSAWSLPYGALVVSVLRTYGAPYVCFRFAPGVGWSADPLPGEVFPSLLEAARGLLDEGDVGPLCSLVPDGDEVLLLLEVMAS